MSVVDSQTRPPWILVAAGSSASKGNPRRRPRALAAVVVAAVLVITAVAVLAIVIARQLAEAETINDTARTADVLADLVVQPSLVDGLLTGDQAAIASMDSAVRAKLLGPSLVRVKIWNEQGAVVYSDAPDLIGETYALSAGELAALAHPASYTTDADLLAPRNRFDQGSGGLLRAYRPIWTPNGTPLLFDAYFRSDAIAATSTQLWRGLAGVLLSCLLLLVALMLPILWLLLDRLGAAQRHREMQLQRSIDVSYRERREIAGTLQVEAVQDLTMASLAVARSADRAAGIGQLALADELRAAAGSVRASVSGLRMLMVDLYPAGLTAAGLPAALVDLAAGLRSTGISVTLDIAPTTRLDAAGDQLAFRVAQECLANVKRHAKATTVSLRLYPTEAYVCLDITDDGIGFDPSSAAAQPCIGHFGLHVIGDLVTGAGAELWLASAPGAGTHWQLRIAPHPAPA